MLMHFIINYRESDIDLYNKKFKDIVENIRDFVLLHYLTGKKDSKFWREFKPNLPNNLKYNLKKWKHRLPIQEDFPGNYQLFNEHNFVILLKELNLIDKNSIKKEYDSLSEVFKNYTNSQIKHHTDYYNDNSNTLGHKSFLQSFRYK